MQHDGLCQISRDILLEICHFLDIKSLVNFTGACRYLRNMATKDIHHLPLYSGMIINGHLLQRFRNLYDLNLTYNKKVTDDNIRGIPITNLNLTNNTSITDSGIREMPITTLDISANKSITDSGIRGMPITKLNLSFNHSITDSGIREMPITIL